MASNITKYATPKVTICNRDRSVCCKSVGERRPPTSLGDPLASVGLELVGSSVNSLPTGCEFAAAMAEVPKPSLLNRDGWPAMCLSNSRPRRRRNSRDITRRITPIHEPANIPLDVIRHVDEMKPIPSHRKKVARDKPGSVNREKGAHMRR